MEATGRVIVVTGGAKGIGRALEPVLAAVSDWAEGWLTTATAAVG